MSSTDSEILRSILESSYFFLSFLVMMEVHNILRISFGGAKFFYGRFFYSGGFYFSSLFFRKIHCIQQL